MARPSPGLIRPRKSGCQPTACKRASRRVVSSPLAPKMKWSALAEVTAWSAMMPGARISISLAARTTASQSDSGATPWFRSLTASAEASSGVAWRIVSSSARVAVGSGLPVCQSSRILRAFSRLAS